MILLFVGLVVVTFGGLAYAFMYERINDERNIGRRMDQINGNDAPIRRSGGSSEVQKRRKDLEASLKRVEMTKLHAIKILNPPLHLQIKQAGLFSMKAFWIVSVVSGIILSIISVGFGMPTYIIPATLLIGSLGLPRWVVSYLRNRRIKAFLDKFPDAIDVIIRAVKSGLPLNDGLRLIANEAAEPVKTEFQRIVDAQRLACPRPKLF